jgi:WD40 repeat protein
VPAWIVWTSLEPIKLDYLTSAFVSRSSSGTGSANDEAVRLWDPHTGQEVQRLEGHTGSVRAVAFSPDGSLLASASYDETVRLWDPRTGQEIRTFEEQPGITTIGFPLSGTALLTNRGMIYIDNESIPCTNFGSSAGQSLSIKYPWIRQGDYDLLLLPQEYRSNCSAFYGNTIAIGLNSGQVRFIQLDNMEIRRGGLDG